jgi:hypothetical protein
MGTNNAQGDKVKDYFLSLEKVVHIIMASQVRISPLIEHTKRENQVSNVKAHAKTAYEAGGKEEVIRRHTGVCIALMNKTPEQLKEEAKALGIPAKYRKSAREYLRYQYPSAACTASIIDELGSVGVPLNNVLPGVSKFKETFEFILNLNMGIIPGELNL